MQLQRLIQQKQSQGVDISVARELDRKSQEAMQQGRPDECLSLLNEAIALLREDEQKVPTGARRNLQYENSPFGMHTAAKRQFFTAQDVPPSRSEIDEGIKVVSQFEYSDAVNIGVKWDRPVFYSFYHPRATDFMDVVYGQIPEGMNILANIETPRLRGTFKLRISDQEYMDFVTDLVERYDGDGIDDMPGLKVPIKYWQVDNEPPFFQFGVVDRIYDKPLDIPDRVKILNNTRDDYARILELAAKAIKSASPDCKMLIGGIVEEEGDYLKVMLEEFYIPILKKLKAKNIDMGVLDFHYYGNSFGHYKKSGIKYRILREMLDRLGYEDTEIWITETGTFNNQPEIPGIQVPYQSEKNQAGDLVKRYVYPLALGVKKVFWALSMVEGEGPIDNNDQGDNLGFMYDGIGPNDLGYGTKKLAYYTYKKMTEVLEGSNWDNIETIRESGGIYIYKFLKDDKPVWVAWNDNEEPKRVTITLDNDTKNVKITEAVPRYKSGKEVKDYDAAFDIETKPAEEGRVDLILGDSPVYAESL